MNERIKQLYSQAGLTMNNPLAYEQWYLDALEKFAELIVRECMSVSEDVANADGEGPWFEGYVSGVEEVTRRLKQHFGVEA